MSRKEVYHEEEQRYHKPGTDGGSDCTDGIYRAGGVWKDRDRRDEEYQARSGFGGRCQYHVPG